MLHQAARRAGNRVVPAVRVVGAALALFSLAACTGRKHLGEEPPHPIAIEVHNNLTLPTELTVFVTLDQGGSRQMLGSVPGAQTRTFTFTPLSWGQTYRFIGERQLAGRIASPPFTVSDPETGTIEWTVYGNMVQFYQMVAPADTTPPPPKK